MALVESDSELAVGDPAPSFSLPATNGKEHGLSDYTDYQALYSPVITARMPKPRRMN